ncbi:type II secretion system F family protein [bacterium]|nr:type II secretion system F family protein [bacterium]
MSAPPIVPEALKSGLGQLRELIKAERYLVSWWGEKQVITVVGSFGLDGENIFTEALSLSLLEEVARTQEPRWSDHDQAEEFSLTFMLSGIKSYLCIPVKFSDPRGTGLLYADDRKRIAQFSFTDYSNVLNLARRLGQPVKQTASRRPPPPAPAVTTPSGPSGPASVQNRCTLPVGQQVTFFRSMATFVQAGIPLLHGLHALAQHGESTRLKNFCTELHRYLLKGNPFSAGCGRLGQFSAMVLQLLTCAENSGQLALVLSQLAQYLEESHKRRIAFLQALIYPGFVLSACLALVIALPTFVLRDQLRAYEAMGGLPLPTRLLLWIGNIASSPISWLVLAALLLALPAIMRSLLRRPETTRLWHEFLWKNPISGRAYCAWQEASLASSLSLQLKAGVPLLEALQSSLLVGGSPLLESQAPIVLEHVRQGDPLSEALMLTPAIRPTFRQMLVAGEESGHLISSLEWISRAAKLEFDQSLDTALQLMEPVIMATMGVVVGFVCLGTLLPSLRLLESI